MKTKEEEKIALAAELGLMEYVSAREHEMVVRKEIEKMTALKFKPITVEEIEKKLETFYFEPLAGPGHKDVWNGYGPMVYVVFGLLGGLVGMFVTMVPFIGNNLLLENGCIAVGAVFAMGFLHVPLACKAKIVKTSLQSWKGNLPLGALYALKEAQAAGMTDFAIFYPVKSGARIKADPVIVGTSLSDGPMYEVFSWDDRKVLD